jgi:RNA ligase (TIGR02306 family)
VSTHEVRVVEIGETFPHPNADSLHITTIGGWQVVIPKTVTTGTRGFFVEPDYVVPLNRPEFSFLKKKEGRETYRIKAIKLRGENSYGLFSPLPPELSDSLLGADIMEPLGITRYLPTETFDSAGEDDTFLPPNALPKIIDHTFDLESLQNYSDLIFPGEDVRVSEKIHGTNARYLYLDGVYYVGTRRKWLNTEKVTVWSRALTDSMRTWLRVNEGVVLYGEVYGPVQTLQYGQHAPTFAAFGARCALSGAWVEDHILHDTLSSAGVAVAPLVYEGPFDLDIIKKIAEEDSSIGPKGHMREGLVILPAYGIRQDRKIGRVALKYISMRYWNSNH